MSAASVTVDQVPKRPRWIARGRWRRRNRAWGADARRRSPTTRSHAFIQPVCRRGHARTRNEASRERAASLAPALRPRTSEEFMVIVQAVLAAIFRSAGKLLNTAFGWATVMLFGRVPQDRQIYLSGVSFGSVIWLLALVGVAFPKAGTFLLSFIPLPDWVDRTWIRLAMLAAAIVVPALVGALATRLVDPEDRPRGAGAFVKSVLRGYPYTVGLAVTLILMIVFAPILKVRDLARRWTTQHVPVIVEAEDYPSVVDDLQHALESGGIKTARGRPSWMLRMPTRLLAFFAGSAVGELVAANLTRLYAPNVEVLLHPSDMVISGRNAESSRARALIAEHLTFTRAYLTWDKEANEIEDALRRVWDSVREGSGVDALARLRAI